MFASHTAVWAQPAAGLDLLPGARAAGSARLRFWGLDIYDASLWVESGFRHGEFARHAFLLELAYLRAFTGAEIADRSIGEMQRTGELTGQQAARWRDDMAGLLPGVKRGDRVAGINRPGRGAQFAFNGKPLGEIADPQFARLFFGIWLAPTTSQPGLREALLAGTAA